MSLVSRFVSQPLSRALLRLAPVCLALTLTGSAAAAARRADPDADKIHVVGAGQTLAKIAKRYHVSVPDLREANDLAPGQKLHSGMRLVIPEASKKSRAGSRDKASGKGGKADRDRDRDRDDDDEDPPPRARGRDRNARHDGKRSRDDDSRTSASRRDDRRNARDDDDDRDDDRRKKPSPDSGAHSSRTGGVVKSGHLRLVHGSQVWEGKVFDKKGKLSSKAVDAFTRLLSDSSGKRHAIEPRLIALVATVSEHFGGRSIEVVSGFRAFTKSQHTPHSKHNGGAAIDFRVRGIDNAELRDFTRTLRNTGVGYYPNSSFVHLDVRDMSTFWVDHSKPGEAPRYNTPDGGKDADETTSDVLPGDPSGAGSDAKKDPVQPQGGSDPTPAK